MSDADVPASVAGLGIETFDGQLQAIQNALVVLADAGVDVSDVSMGVKDGALAANVTLDGAALADAGLSAEVASDVAVGDGSDGGEGSEDESEAPVPEGESADGPEIDDDIVENPTTAKELRRAIAVLAPLDGYLDYEGDKPPQFSKRHRVEIALAATSLDEDRLADHDLSEQARFAVVAHGFDPEKAAGRQYYLKDELEKIHRQLTDEATAPGVPEEYDPNPGGSVSRGEGAEAATDGGTAAQAATGRRDSEPVPGVDLPQSISVDDVETAVSESATPTEAAQALRISRDKMVRAANKLGLGDEIDVNEGDLHKNAKDALGIGNGEDDDTEPDWVETGPSTEDSENGPNEWSDFAANGGADS
jgi:hypothetical protein